LHWERVWEGLIESAERFHLTRIRLNVFLPRLHEDFFATWERKRDVGTDHYCSAEIPLVVDDQLVGYLNVTGVQPSGSSGRMIADFAELVEPLESQVEGVLTANRAAAPREAPVDEVPESSEGLTAETKRASVLSG
jgi:hypothetical protein